jgi:oxygen-independent coproporphyrinogen-3 oxidase
LQVLGRIHSPEETRRAAEELHTAGIENFNLDLMYALPGQDVAAAMLDVEAAIALRPTHLSHYQLTLEPGTVFAAEPPELPEDDVAAAMLSACAERLAEAGLAQYEVSAHARTNRQCRHNLNYWRFGDYLGVGAGAHGKLTFPAENAVVRTTQPREPRRYLASVPGGAARSSVPAEELPFEFMLNALRLVEGFEISMFVQRTGIEWDRIAGSVDDLVRRQLLVVEGPRLRPSASGLRFLNDVLLRFLPGSAPKIPQTTGGFGLSMAV